MPTKQQHLSQASHNEAFVAQVESTTFKDWATVGIFYSVLHYIEAFLATRNIHNLDHQKRDTYVGVHFTIDVYKDYGKLKLLSRRLRYDCYPGNEEQLSKSKERLERIRSTVIAMLN